MKGALFISTPGHWVSQVNWDLHFPSLEQCGDLISDCKRSLQLPCRDSIVGERLEWKCEWWSQCEARGPGRRPQRGTEAQLVTVLGRGQRWQFWIIRTKRHHVQLRKGKFGAIKMKCFLTQQAVSTCNLLLQDVVQADDLKRLKESECNELPRETGLLWIHP